MCRTGYPSFIGYSRQVFRLNSELLTSAYKITFDSDKCVGCGQCVDICPVSVWEMHDGKSDPVNAEECLGCESCTGVCEHDAIVIEED